MFHFEYFSSTWTGILCNQGRFQQPLEKCGSLNNTAALVFGIRHTQVWPRSPIELYVDRLRVADCSWLVVGSC